MMNSDNKGRIGFKEMYQWCSDLENCAATGNSENISKLLKRFPSNTTDGDGNTLLLHYVTKSDDDNVEIIKYLIEAGFNVNFRNDEGQMVLFKAVIKNKIKSIKFLMNLGAFNDHTYYMNRINSLRCAAEEVHIEILKILVEAGCNVNAKDSDDLTPLDYVMDDICFEESALKVAKILLDAGASRDHTYYVTSTGPLHSACLNQDPKMVKLLLDSGFKVSVKDGTGCAPLHLVMEKGKFDAADDDNVTNIIKLLIQAGADVNSKTNYGTTTLHLAVFFNYNNVFDLLREAGAELDVVDDEGNTLLHMLGTFGDNNIYFAKQLIKAGADINKVNNEGQNCLFNVTKCASVELLKYFIQQHRAKLDILDYNGMDLLGLALGYWGSNDYRKNSEWTTRKQKLSDHDADVEKKFGKEKIESQIKCIEILCEHGVDVNRVKKDGDSPFYLALTAYCHTKIIRALLRKGAIVNFNHYKVRKIMDKKNYNLKLQRIIIQHAAMCNLFKQGKGRVNFSLKKMNRQQVQDYKNCVEELKTLRNFCVYESMPLLNLIEGPVTSRYILNDYLSGLFETGVIANSFPMFYEVLRERFEEEREKYELILKASSSLQILMKFNERSYDHIYRNILSYLGTKDHRNLASLIDMEID